MAYTTPRTWVIGETVTAAMLNEQVRDNISYLYDQAVPPGVFLPYGGTSAPTGFLLCQGQAVSRAVYATLFGILSTTYGVGDGSTTFNLPDLRQRFPLGKAASGTGSTLGSTGGAIDHTHAGPSHTHTINSDGAHTHTFTTGNESSITELYTDGGGPDVPNSPHTHSGTTDSDGDHNHGGSTDSAGTGSTNSNNPPYLVVNYIVKY